MFHINHLHDMVNEHTCGALNENGLHRIIYLNVWSLTSGIVLGWMRRYGLVGRGVSVGVDFEASKVHARLTLFPFSVSASNL